MQEALKIELMISDVHIDDVSDAFIFLVEEAVKPNGGNAQWGDEGYYFAEAGEFVSPAQVIHDTCWISNC
jgi:hypothetical protein